VRIHGTAVIKQQQNLHGITSFRAHDDIEQAASLGCLIDRCIDIKLVFSTGTGKLAQPAKGNLYPASTEFNVIIVCLVISSIPGTFSPPFLTLSSLAFFTTTVFASMLSYTVKITGEIWQRR